MTNNIQKAIFYLDVSNILYFSCHLCRRIINEGQSVVILQENLEDQTELSDILWSYLPDSFLAHEICNELELTGMKSLILLTTNENISIHHNHPINLLNLKNNFIESPQYNKIMYMVEKNSKDIELSRELYLAYQKKNVPLEHFNVGKLEL